MSQLVLVILIFLAAGLTLLAANLVIGRLVRPDRPSPEKGEVYECGEKPIGTAWVQFDLRFYVVALLFVIFDVELAFFFPWATVFGSANRVADESRPVAQRIEAAKNLQPQGTTADPEAARLVGQLGAADFAQREAAQEELRKLGMKAEAALTAVLKSDNPEVRARAAKLLNEIYEDALAKTSDPAAAKSLAWVAFADIMVFFGVLLVGFAYLWRRGDLEWVRSTAAQDESTKSEARNPKEPEPATTS